jgi:hypothetical protein
LDNTVIELNADNKTHECDVSGSEEDEKASEDETTSETNSKVCPYCAKTYTYRKSFNKHIEKCPNKQVLSEVAGNEIFGVENQGGSITSH